MLTFFAAAWPSRPPVPPLPSRPRPREPDAHLPRLRPELAALLVLAALLDLWALGQNGFANEYYAAAVRSMSGELARLPLRLLRRRRRR